MDIARLLDILLRLLMFAIVGRAIFSFLVPVMGGSPHPVLVQINMALGQITEPLLGPIRRVLPTMGMLDLSPMVAIVVLEIVRRVLLSNI